MSNRVFLSRQTLQDDSIESQDNGFVIVVIVFVLVVVRSELNLVSIIK